MYLNRKETVTEIAWPLDVNVFEKLRFRSSTLHHLAGVFKFFSLWRPFLKSSVFVDQKRRFSVDDWPNRRKKDAFSNLSGLVLTEPEKICRAAKQILQIDGAGHFKAVFVSELWQL